jgi:hypothetical protein
MEFFVNRKIQSPTARIVPATIAIAPAATINRASHNPVHPEVLQQPISTQNWNVLETYHVQNKAKQIFRPLTNNQQSEDSTGKFILVHCIQHTIHASKSIGSKSSISCVTSFTQATFNATESWCIPK